MILETLEDLLAPHLKLVLVGINPSHYAVAQGHYFARPQNRFWPAFSASRLGIPICTALGVARLLPEHDRLLPGFGVGLTDLVKIPSSNASFVTPAMYREAVPRLRATLTSCRPKVIAFHGMMAFRPFLKHGLQGPLEGRRGEKKAPLGVLGLQSVQLDNVPIFVLPNPSGANARYGLKDLIGWYDALAEVVDEF